MLNSQRCDTVLENVVVGLNLNIPVNTKDYFRLTDFWAIYISISFNATL
jgi:hypothetical protein